MKKEFAKKIKEALLSALPIILIVLILHFTKIAPISNQHDFIIFLICSIFLILGIGLFSLGSDMSMMPMGEYVGKEIIKSKKLWLGIIIVLILGTLITIAEPDLSVLANQVPVSSITLILTVSLGVGIFLAIALLRILFKIDLRILLFVFYALLFVLAIFANQSFLPLAFDSGGVTTGPITVPFLMSLGVGLATMSNSKSSADNFGTVALCSIGPILAVMILSLFLKDTPIYESTVITSHGSILKDIGHGLVDSLKEVGIALSPIFIFFFIFQWFKNRLSKRKMVKIIVGLLYTYIGLVLFLTAVNIGFMPVGIQIGETLAATNYSWVLVPLGFVMGIFVVLAEPAVHTLNKEVEEISQGTISKKSMLISLSIGVGLSLALSMLRLIFKFSVMWYLVPGYAIALLLTLFVPKVYTAIAFDSGGVASGPMTAGFILPFAIGACSMLEMDVLEGGFGIVAMVAMTPLITIQLLGFHSVMKEKIKLRLAKAQSSDQSENTIINFE